jgi:DNA primase
MSVADEIKARLDIVSYIQQYAPLKKAGRTYKACCVFHSERTPSFVVNPDTQSWRCFGACAQGGDVISFAMKFHNWSFGEALRELGKQVGVEVEDQTPEQRQRGERLDVLRGLMNTIAEAYHHYLLDPQNAKAASALKYAREKRGFSDETIQRYQIGYAPDDWHSALNYLREVGYTEDDILETGMASRNDAGKIYDRFRDRLMIPIRDERGRVIAFGARALNPDDNPKYLNSPQTPLFDKSRVLFGLDTAKNAIRDSETAVIVEGYMDAITAHQAGFGNVVAQMGTAMTEHQLKLLVPRWAKKIIMALDSDAAGQNATRRGLEVARNALLEDYTGKLSVDMRVLSIPGAKDPDDLIRESPQNWAELVDNALPVADFVIMMETQALPANASVQEREAAAQRLLPLLLASENNLHKKDNLQKLALKLRILERDLLAWAEEQRRIETAKPPRPVQPVEELEAPEFPPLDYDSVEPPAFEDEGYQVPRPVRVVKKAPPSKDAALEMDCLRALLKQPETFYQINRKFRELAANDTKLVSGPLGDLCADDFSQSDYRALMSALERAMEQDETEVHEHLRLHLDSTLHGTLDQILVDDLDNLMPRLRYSSEDLSVIKKQSERFYASVDPIAELVRQALRLRNRRLQREREELYFLHVEAQENTQDYSEQVSLSVRAKKLIDAELQRQLSFSH